MVIILNFNLPDRYLSHRSTLTELPIDKTTPTSRSARAAEGHSLRIAGRFLLLSSCFVLGSSLASVASFAAGTATPSALSCSKSSLTGRDTDTCTVKLSSPAPSGGLAVKLRSNNTAAEVPATLKVAAGAKSASTTAAVSSVATTRSVVLTAEANGVSQSTALTLNAATRTLTASATSIAFGQVAVNSVTTRSLVLTSSGSRSVTIRSATITGTGFALKGLTTPLTLNPGTSVSLTVSLDPTVAGTAAGTLTFSSSSWTNNTLKISLSGTATSSVALGAVSCGTGSFTGAGSDACKVSLTGAAPAGGLNISLSSNNKAVTVPATVAIPANATSAAFTAAVSSVTTAQAVTLSANAGGVAKTVALQLNAYVPTLAVSAGSVAFGNVAVNTPTTQYVSLSSTGTAPVTISSTTVSGAGFSISGPSLPLTLAPGQTFTLGVQFDPTTASAATGQITVGSNSSTNASSTIALSGTGTSAVAISVSPASTSVSAKSNQQFSASVSGTSNTSVSWAVSGSGCSGSACGTISSSGLYSAPSIIPVPSTVTITATSAANSKSANATVDITPYQGVSYYLAPASAGGNDSNNGLSPSTPWLSPKHALNCGDTITAAVSSAYQQTQFQFGQWGTVSCSPGSQANVAWLKCAEFDGCKLAATSQNGIWVTSSYWGVEGFEVTASGGAAICFSAYPPTGTANIHHIIFANNIANGCYGAGFEPVPNGTAGVDYFTLIGNIAYNGTQESAECSSGITIFQPVQSDTLPGTHIYVAGNFSWGNFNPAPCAGQTPTDGEGIIFDTFDANSYTQQAVMEDNIAFMNGSSGFRVDMTTKAPIYIVNNTSYGNNGDQAMNSTWCGEFTLQESNGINVSNNIAMTNSASGCGKNPNYAYYVGEGGSADMINSNFGYGMNGQNGGSNLSPGFAYGSANLFGASPEFVNPPSSNPGAPNCSGHSSVVDCMSSTISGLTPKASAAIGFGYQPPTNTFTSDPLFPTWLCNANLPSGLIPNHC